MAVVKLKNSLPYVENDDSTGVQYPHLSIRGLNKPECLGCYTNGRGGNADFAADACTECSNDNLRILFFQLTAMAMNSEIAVDENTPNPLKVNFEFSIGGVLYVTRTSKSLSQLSAGGDSDASNKQHDLYNSLPTGNEEFKWPKKITIDTKRFGVVCSSDTPHDTDCPYEGLESTSLQITATSVNVARRTVYTFRTIAGGELHVRMDAFHIGACPNMDPFVQQKDFLQIVQYTELTGHRSQTRYDQNTVIREDSTTAWTLSEDLDQLQIIIANDGNNCLFSPNKFDMHFTVRNTIFPTTDLSPCTAGNYGNPGTCQVCASGSYKPGFGVGDCLDCPDSKPVSAQGSVGIQQCVACATNSNKVANSNKDNCVCKPGYEIKTGENGCSTCGVGFYKVEKGDATCDLCTDGATTGSEGSTRADQCQCDTVRGYECDTTTNIFLCKQVEITIIQQLEIQMAFSDVSNNRDDIQIKFKEALAEVYSITVEKITLSYYSKDDPNNKETVRRRRLLDADITIIEASIVAFQAISNTVTNSQMTNALSQKGSDNVVVLASDYEAEPDGAVFNLLWIVAFCIAALVLVILVGWAWCVLYFRKKSETFQSLPQIMPGTSEIVFICDAAYDAQHYSEPHHDSFLL